MTLRTALRNLLKSPRLSLAAVACISLGAAATPAIATLVTATLLRPLPFPDADRLVRIWFDDGRGNARVSLSIPDVGDAASLSSFDRLLGTARVRIVALLDGGAERMRGEAVTPDYFDTLGIMRGVLYGVSAFDAGAFAGATILLVAIALTASILPARRASALDPVGALRSE